MKASAPLGGCLWRVIEIGLALAIALAAGILLYDRFAPLGGTP